MKRGIDMRIALFGPNVLTPFDQQEIRNYIEAVIEEHSVSVLDRSIEREVFKFFVENEQYAHKLTIYTFQEFEYLQSDIQTTIQFLIKKGSAYKSFYNNEPVIRRTPFIETWEFIMDENDAIMTFFDGKNPKLMIPSDIAKKMNKRPFQFSLPLYNESLMNRKPTDKIKIIV